MFRKNVKGLNVGDTIPDGTIFAGISPNTRKQMFVTPKDEEGIAYRFENAAQRVKNINKDKPCGHKDWRLPTKEELNVLFQNREKGALKGTFNMAGSQSYWSSTPKSGYWPWVQHFNDGGQCYGGYNAIIRCVR